MKINQKRIDNIMNDLDKRYLSWFIKDYILLGEVNLEKLKNKKILYFPNHVSHFDYVLIPFILNKHKIPHPAIVAGQNLNNWPTSKLISEETGAVFVDRKKIENGNTAQKKEELQKINKSVEDVVRDNYDFMVFIEGGRSYDCKIMESQKEKYPKEYLLQISKQNKNYDEYFGVNIAVNYKPHTIEKPFLEAVKFFKRKSFPLYFGLDLLSFITQPIRKKPTAYINFGEPYPLKEFGGKNGSKELINFVKEDVKRLFNGIN